MKTTIGGATFLAPVWGNLARRVGNGFRKYFRLEGMDGAHARYEPEAEIFLILHRMRISAKSNAPITVAWKVRDRLSDDLRFKVAQRRRSLDRRATLPRERDLASRQDPALAEVEAVDESAAFFAKALAKIERSKPAMLRSALAFAARFMIEMGWNDSALVGRFPQYRAVRAQVTLLRPATDLVVERAGFGSFRRASAYLRTEMGAFQRRST